MFRGSNGLPITPKGHLISLKGLTAHSTPYSVRLLCVQSKALLLISTVKSSLRCPVKATPAVFPATRLCYGKGTGPEGPSPLHPSLYPPLCGCSKETAILSSFGPLSQPAMLLWPPPRKMRGETGLREPQGGELLLSEADHPSSFSHFPMAKSLPWEQGVRA